MTWEALPEVRQASAYRDSAGWVWVTWRFALWVPVLSAVVYSGLRRKVLYQRAPRNIHRHVILSEIKEAVAALPSVRGVWNVCMS